MDRVDLRYGLMAGIYYEIAGERLLRQLDLLNAWFPGVEWYCDGCGAHLNEQAGFDDHVDAWQCTACGHENPLSIEEIYDSEEDYAHDVHAVDAARFEDAIERRRKELAQDDCEINGQASEGGSDSE